MASIEQNLQSLITAKNDIATAITEKGVPVPAGSGFLDFSDMISKIESGGDVKIGTLRVSSGNVDSGATDTICIKMNKVILAHAFIPKDYEAFYLIYSLHFDDFDITPIEYIKWIRIAPSTGEYIITAPYETAYSNNQLAVTLMNKSASTMTFAAGHRFVLITLP